MGCVDNGSLNGAEGLVVCAAGGTCCALYAARVTKSRGTTPRLQDDTQRWGLLLAKEGDRIDGGGVGITNDEGRITLMQMG